MLAIISGWNSTRLEIEPDISMHVAHQQYWYFSGVACIPSDITPSTTPFFGSDQHKLDLQAVICSHYRSGSVELEAPLIVLVLLILFNRMLCWCWSTELTGSVASDIWLSRCSFSSCLSGEISSSTSIAGGIAIMITGNSGWVGKLEAGGKDVPICTEPALTAAGCPLCA